MTFRPAAIADIPLLRDLAHRIWRNSYPGMIPVEQIEYMLGWMYSAEKIAAEIADGVHWEIAEVDGMPIGFFSLTFHGATLAVLNKLYLLLERQGRGLGQVMLAQAFAFASSHGATELRLRVNKRNARALRSYDRAGFRIAESLTAEIGGGFVMDDYVLSRSIP